MMAAPADTWRTPRRPSQRAGWVGVLLLALGLAVLGHAAGVRQHQPQRLASARALVQALDLTDMAWFTEARYTRHPGLADLHSAFQDGPGALEHFPAGAWVPAPRPAPAVSLHPPPPGEPGASR